MAVADKDKHIASRNKVKRKGDSWRHKKKKRTKERKKEAISGQLLISGQQISGNISQKKLLFNMRAILWGLNGKGDL